MSKPHVTVCVCTYRRPQLLRRLLEKLERQETHDLFSYDVVVVDNDEAGSGRETVDELIAQARLEARYEIESRRNIALARNRGIELAKGDFIAFIDDDEFPEAAWLARLLRSCQTFKAAGVLGPVRPHFETPPPDWVVKGRFCERAEQLTGTVIAWRKCRTGNVLFRRDILPPDAVPFDEQFGTGGEDVDFFMRMNGLGHTFVWCNEAVVYESVPPLRMKRGYMLRRALLRGGNSLKLSNGRLVLVLKALVAVPLYLLALPVSCLFGQHHLMNYGIRLCDHAGRVFALFGLNRIKERQM